MSREKIEEMANTIYDNRPHKDVWLEDAEDIAKVLYDADYRKQEWTSVEERLPSEEEYRDEYGELIPILVCEKDTQYPYRAMYDGTEWGDGLMKIRGITHWMPLPEPPKMKGGEE